MPHQLPFLTTSWGLQPQALQLHTQRKMRVQECVAGTQRTCLLHSQQGLAVPGIWARPPKKRLLLSEARSLPQLDLSAHWIVASQGSGPGLPRRDWLGWETGPSCQVYRAQRHPAPGHAARLGSPPPGDPRPLPGSAQPFPTFSAALCPKGQPAFGSWDRRGKSGDSRPRRA